MSLQTISSTAQARIKARTEIVLRTIIGKNIIDRVISPIQTIRKSNGCDVVYSQMKKIYEYPDDLSKQTVFTLDQNKMNLIAVKSMNSTTTENNKIEHIILSLESSGYVTL